MKEVMGCVQSVFGKNKFLFLFEDGQKKQIGSCLLVHLSEKEEVDMEESITLFPEKEKGALLTINGDPADGEPCMFVQGMYLSVFYCLFYYTDIYTDISEAQVAEERDPDLNKKEDIRFNKIWEDNQRDIAEENYDKKKINALRWDVYVKEKEELIKREFSVSVPYFVKPNVLLLVEVWISLFRHLVLRYICIYIGIIAQTIKYRKNHTLYKHARFSIRGITINSQRYAFFLFREKCYRLLHINLLFLT